MAKSAVETLVAKIDADIARLQAMRAYVLERSEPEPDAAPKKERKKRKARGLPAVAEASGF